MYLDGMIYEEDIDGLICQLQDFLCPKCKFNFGDWQHIGIMKIAKFCPICGANLEEIQAERKMKNETV